MKQEQKLVERLTGSRKQHVESLKSVHKIISGPGTSNVLCGRAEASSRGSFSTTLTTLKLLPSAQEFTSN